MQRSRGTLAARNITKSYGDTVVLEGLSLTVTQSSRIGVVGPNGIGKSTLLRLLAGIDDPDSGAITREPPDLSVAYLAQERQAAGLSGGEAARRQLEAILAAEPGEVLLLDEPTNDLDFAALTLLDRFVASHRGGLVVVSHDRVFLEGMTSILEFEGETRRILEYTGGWQQFAEQRAATRARHESAYAGYTRKRERVEAQVRRMREWEERGYGHGRKKKKSKDVKKAGEKKLARIERVEKPWSPWRLQLHLAAKQRGGDVAVRLEQATIERGGFRLGPVDLELRHGDRLVVLGRNGAGKTTLLKALLGELPLTSGSRWVGPGASLGELPQRQSLFAGGEQLLDSFVAEAGLAVGEARSLLATFALGADDVLRAGRSLSPGERSRATLALLAAHGVNALVLDEPTNNLDLEAIEQLEFALEHFEGAVALVTHDRHFLEAFGADQTIEL